MPFEGQRFDKLYSVNTIYFWESLAAGLTEARRVLKEGGRLAVGFLPEDAMNRLGYPKDIFTYRSVDEVRGAVERAGFGAVEMRRLEKTAWAVVVAS